MNDARIPQLDCVYPVTDISFRMSRPNACRGCCAHPDGEVPPHTIEIRRGAASLVQGAWDIQIPRITLGTTFPSSTPFVEQADAGMLTIRSAASQESVPVI